MPATRRTTTLRALHLATAAYFDVEETQAESTRRLLSKARLVDVRHPADYHTGHIAGATNIALHHDEFESFARALEPGEHVVLYCRTGNQASQAAERIRKTAKHVKVTVTTLPKLAQSGATVSLP